MQLKFERLGDVLRVEVRSRETAEETREAIEKTLAEREKHGPAVHSAHQYLELVAAQRRIAVRAFTREAEALAWLRGPG